MYTQIPIAQESDRLSHLSLRRSPSEIGPQNCPYMHYSKCSIEYIYVDCVGQYLAIFEYVHRLEMRQCIQPCIVFIKKCL